MYLESQVQNLQVDAPIQILHLVSHVRSLQHDLLHRPCIWGNISILQVTPSDDVPEVRRHSFQGEFTPQIVYLGSHFQFPE